jgi:hypothetical protein
VVEVLDEIEDVALRLAERIPPAPPVMGDDQDLALAAAVLQGAALPGLLGAAGCAIAPFLISYLRNPGTAKSERCKGAASAGGGRAAPSLAARPAQAVGATFLRLRRGLGRSGPPTFYVESTRARPSSGLQRIFSLWRLLALEGSANRPNWADVESARASGCCRTTHWLEFACGVA